MTDAAHDRPFDPGLQIERTLLAWRRTCLALAIGNLFTIRYLTEAVGSWAAVLGVLGVGSAGIAWVIATIRYRRIHVSLVHDDPLASDGKVVALVAASILAACIAALVLLATLWRPW